MKTKCIKLATVTMAYGKEDSKSAEEGTLPLNQYDTICFDSKKEAQAYCAGIVDGNGWDEVYTSITTVEI